MVSYFTDFHTSTLNLTEMWWQSNRILLPELFSKLSTNYFTFQIMKSETKSNEISSPHSFRMICFRYIFFVENVQSYLWHSFWYEEFWMQILLIFDNIVAELKITNFLFNLSSFSRHLFSSFLTNVQNRDKNCPCQEGLHCICWKLFNR